VALNETDRYMRFGYPATDAQMSKYVDMLDFDNDEVFGIFNRRLELIAMAHLANAPASSEPGRPRMSEFGVSVLSSVRGRGFGARLFERATLHARNRGVDTVFIHALSENMAMLRIARNAGAVVERSGSESDAWLKLPPDSIATQVNELVEHQAAEIDYRFKVHAHRVNSVLDTISEVAAGIKKSAHIASE
jgi:RimJ/RimL family protein N-acetyltransferase